MHAMMWMGLEILLTEGHVLCDATYMKCPE